MSKVTAVYIILRFADDGTSPHHPPPSTELLVSVMELQAHIADAIHWYAADLARPKAAPPARKKRSNAQIVRENERDRAVLRKLAEKKTP